MTSTKFQRAMGTALLLIEPGDEPGFVRGLPHDMLQEMRRRPDLTPAWKQALNAEAKRRRVSRRRRP
jgi:hypothetical protein